MVTGGLGYIGSHTTVALINAGYEVVIVDNLSNSQIEVLDRIEKITNVRPDCHILDLCDLDKTKELFGKNKIDSIIHFAAHKAPGESVYEPLKYYRNNLLSLMNILLAASESKVHNLVHSSSCTVYGQPDKLPVSEDTPIKKAESPYGNTKIICEDILRDTVHANDKLKVIALRYFNPIGAHQSSLIGELPLGTPINLVPVITQHVAGLYKVLKVFGSDYNTPDGTPIRDYIHIEDLADAHISAMTRMENNKNKENFEVFNVGTGQGRSVLEMIEIFERVTGEKVNYKIVERREGDPESVYASVDLANNELGWKAKKSIEDALKSAWAWEKKYRKI